LKVGKFSYIKLVTLHLIKKSVIDLAVEDKVTLVLDLLHINATLAVGLKNAELLIITVILNIVAVCRLSSLLHRFC